jgi:2-polyprenyl-3-methyl-5-hydroxy-6-metoxy-1,4-benzoquinol methylase
LIQRIYNEPTLATNTSKYYDYTRDRPINLEKDGCVFDDWKRSYGKALFARHSQGFLVFLEPHEIEASDEYNEADPYSVEARITGDFQKRRIDCTLEMVKEAAGRLQAEPRILDLGCGQGHITALINQEVPVAEVCGLDYSISAITYANKKFPGIDFVVASAYQCPYREGYFDIVVCNNLWEHVPDPLHLLSKISRVMSAGGFLIISTPSRYRWGNLVNVLRGKPIQFMSEHHVTEYSVGQVIEQLRYRCFEVIRCYSKPFKSRNLKFEAAKKLFSVFAAITGSHHQLESTVFYLTQRTQKNSRDVSQ